MALTGKALWVIERHLDTPLSLGDIAAACGVSRFHLARAFSARSGLCVMQYVRCRRLTQAAVALVAGAPDILGLALETGYGSHEAFSRAFRAQFGVTPETARRNRTIEETSMVKAMQRSGGDGIKLADPRFLAGDPMLLVGLSAGHRIGSTQDIAAQWQRFMASYADIACKTRSAPIGVSMNMDDDGNFDYLCAVEVSKFSNTPKGLEELRIAAQTYAVFSHRKHVSRIGETYAAIWNDWFPAHACQPEEAPSLERHLDSFDPRTGLGGVDIWIPVRRSSLSAGAAGART